MKKLFLFAIFVSADDGHNEDCKDIDVGTKCELDCEAVNKEKLVIALILCYDGLKTVK